MTNAFLIIDVVGCESRSEQWPSQTELTYLRAEIRARTTADNAGQRDTEFDNKPRFTTSQGLQSDAARHCHSEVATATRVVQTVHRQTPEIQRYTALWNFIASDNVASDDKQNDEGNESDIIHHSHEWKHEYYVCIDT